ncbi:MAG: DUF5615 family PIN-like protein [Candidatus Omnitrophota bacterium]
MEIKLDENMPQALAERLCAEGHNASTVSEENLSGASDDSVLKHATEESRLLMTFDVDFGDIRSYPVGSHAGVIVFRFNDQQWTALKEPVERLLRSGALESLPGSLAIIDEKRIRFRRKKDV